MPFYSFSPCITNDQILWMLVIKISIKNIASRRSFLASFYLLCCCSCKHCPSVCRNHPYSTLTFLPMPVLPVVKKWGEWKVRDVWQRDCTHVPLGVTFSSSSCCFSNPPLHVIWRLDYHSWYCSPSPDCPCSSLTPSSAPTQLPNTQRASFISWETLICK